MKTTVKRIAVTAVLTAVICAISPWTIPVGPIPISLASFGVYIAACTIDWKTGTVSVVAYVAIGAIGLPVFSGGEGGFGKLAGPTGGYIIGYIFCTLIIGVLVDALGSRRTIGKLFYPLSMIAGTAVLYAFGTAWYMWQTSAALGAALLVCVVPFLIGDAIKIALASLICPQLRRTLKKTVLRERPAEHNGKSDDGVKENKK